MNQNERWQWQKVTGGRFFCESSIIEYLCKRNMNEKEIKKDMATTSKGIMQNNDSEYVRLVSQISGLWEKAKEKAAFAVNTELLKASWETGRYIVEYEQHGSVKTEYGKQLLTNLSKDLTRLRGKGYSRSNLFKMRLFYVRFPKIQTVSGLLC